MKLIYRNLLVPYDREQSQIPALLARRLGVSRAAIGDWQILRRSLDSRHGRKPRYQFTIVFEASQLQAVQLLRRRKSAVEPYHEPIAATYPVATLAPGQPRPVVVGAGPAGLFAAYRLAQQGRPPIVLERGPEVTERSKRWAGFLRGKKPFDSECNLLFGEGGAGTYSDGKLYTRVKDDRVGEVLRVLAEHGAPAEITYSAKPHVGSNLLPSVVRNLRKALIDQGVDFQFDACVSRLHRTPTAGGYRVEGVETTDGNCWETDALFLGIGHSARDSYRMLHECGVAMAQKPFQLGVRIEHPQAVINRIQYGKYGNDPRIEPADYQWVVRRQGGNVFSFCMCPGGEILPATEKEGFICVNGASRHKRIGEFANSGFVVTLEPEHFPDAADPLSGVALQEQIESRAAAVAPQPMGAPALRLIDFVAGQVSADLPASSYPLALSAVPFEKFLPQFVHAALRDGLGQLLQRYPVLADPEAIVVAPESRSSSPLRMLRDPDTLQSTSVQGLYPMGEGAGFAGGIMSAALDGMRCAELWIAATS